MFHLSKRNQRAVLLVKITEIELDPDLSKKDKEQIIKYYKKQMPAVDDEQQDPEIFT